jgi:hypothetical protein
MYGFQNGTCPVPQQCPEKPVTKYANVATSPLTCPSSAPCPQNKTGKNGNRITKARKMTIHFERDADDKCNGIKKSLVTQYHSTVTPPKPSKRAFTVADFKQKRKVPNFVLYHRGRAVPKSRKWQLWNGQHDTTLLLHDMSRNSKAVASIKGFGLCGVPATPHLLNNMQFRECAHNNRHCIVCLAPTARFIPAWGEASGEEQIKI